MPPPPAPTPLSGAGLARVPRSGLAALAALRGRPDVVVGFEGEAAWVAWEPAEQGGRDEVVEALLPVPGAAFFRERGGRWYRAGRSLPDFDARPPGEGIGGDVSPALPLHRALVPEPARWEPPRTDWRPARLRLVRDGGPRPASALVATAGQLLPWAESAPTARLRALRAARSGDRILLIGDRLPPVAGLGRYWGSRVLLPVGLRAEPELAEPRLAEAIGLGGGGDDAAVALIGPDARAEVVPGAALVPLCRSAARRMAGIAERLPEGQGGRA